MNDKAFLDINALKSVDHIRKIISQYREQQEQLLNKISPDINRTNHQHIREQNLERLFDHCCVIGVSRNSGYLLGSWPLALIGSFSSKTITLGSFESHGSLWRFVRVDDNHGSLRVVIECSEIGEKPLFLTNNLDLTENNGYAAEWIVSQAPSVQKFPPSFGDLRVIIRAADDRRLLCCNEQAGVSLLSEEECSQTGDSTSSNYWTSEWSIISEDAPLLGNDEFKFLDETDNQTDW